MPLQCHPRALDLLADTPGAALERLGDVEYGGEWFASYRANVRDNRTLIELVNRFAEDDACRAPHVRELAKGIAAWAWTVSPTGWTEIAAKEIHRFVRDSITYVPDEVQSLRSGDAVLAAGEGNCVNTARLIVALARGMGLEAHAVPVPNARGEIRHTAAKIGVGGAWCWAEATIAAEFCENPWFALARLRAYGELEALPFDP